MKRAKHVNLAFTSKQVNQNFQNNINQLDASQLATINTTDEKIVIKAPPGAGKTHVLITAIAAYRYDNMNDNICAITYTRAARGEMEQRLYEMGIYDVHVSTIHVWARELLEHFSKKYGFKIKILQEADIKDILEMLVHRYALERGRRNINIGILYSWISGNKLMDITDGYRRTLIALENRYINYKRDKQLYDFTDYPRYLYDVLTQYNERITNVDALFVDEVQDIDPTQLDLFNLTDAHKKFFIGDFWQSIFLFRGADASVFDRLEDGFSLYKLKHNYRSYQVILDYANTVYEKLREDVENENECRILDVKEANRTGITCDRGSQKGSITILESFTQMTYIDNDDRAIEEMCGWEEIRIKLKDFLSLQPMILCRTNKEVNRLKELGWDNVSTVHQAKGLEYTNVLVVDMNISSFEDLNIAYVALTRARDNVMVAIWPLLESYLQGGNFYGA